MSSYIKQSTCSSTVVPTESGNIVVTGAPMSPTVHFNITDQRDLNQFCRLNKTEIPAGQTCQNFLRNHSMVEFITKTQSGASLKDNMLNKNQDQMLIQQIGTCQSEGMDRYLAWRATTKLDNSQVQNISQLCHASGKNMM